MTKLLEGRPQYTSYSDVLRRLLDIGFSAVAILLVLPVCLLIACVTFILAPGPIFSRSEALGKAGRSFPMLTLRTYSDKQPNTLTRIGRFLRKFSLDQVPLFFSLLRGDLSLVGPRPVTPVYAHTISKIVPDYAERFDVKPGVTGWSQLYMYEMKDYDPRVELILDRDYILNRSLRLDLEILSRTFLSTFRQTKA